MPLSQFSKPLFTFFFIASLLTLTGCKADGQEILNPKEFKDQIQKPGVQLIDIRTPDEYATGYISGALNMDYYNPDFINKIRNLNREKPLALYCKSGGRTKDALKVLAKEGFKIIYALKGGLLTWENQGYTLVMPKPVAAVQTKFTKADFDKLIQSNTLVIIDFSAVWCGPCKLLKPVLEKLSADYAKNGVKIITIDVDQSKELSNELLVNEIPLLLFYKDGKLMEQMLGFNPESIIKQVIEKYL